MKKLSKETEIHPDRPEDSTHRLHDFFIMYPVIFISLRAVFGLLPSASRIVECAHGIMRACGVSQIPLEFMNFKMRYKMMLDHDMREARKKVTRNIMALANDGRAKKRKAAKPHDRKLTLGMIGPQLVKIALGYTNVLVDALPERWRERIRSINKTSATSIEKDVLARKREAAEQKRARKRTAVDLDKIREENHKDGDPITEHDKKWENNEDDVNGLIDKMLTKAYWRKEVDTKDFKVDLFRVFPSFESDAAWKAGKTAILEPSGKEHDVGEHWALIKKIAKGFPKGEVQNTINDVDLTGMKYYEILKVFVKYDQSLTQVSLETARERKMKKLQGVFGIFGTEIASNKRFISEHAYAVMDAQLEDALDEGDDDDENVIAASERQVQSLPVEDDSDGEDEVAADTDEPMVDAVEASADEPMEDVNEDDGEDGGLRRRSRRGRKRNTRYD